MEEIQAKSKIADKISELLSDCYSWVKSQIEFLYKLACENLPVFWANVKSFLFKFIRKFKLVLIKINNFLDVGTEAITTEETVESNEVNETSLKVMGNDCIIIIKESKTLLAKVALVLGCVKKWEALVDGLKKSTEVMEGVVDLAEQSKKSPFSSLVGVVDEIVNHKKEKDGYDSSRVVSKLQGKGSVVVREMLSLKVA